MALDSLVRLRYFVSFAETGRIASVATLFDVNESCISRALHALQEQSKYPLFAQKGRRLELTAFGWSFYQRVRPTLSSLDELYDDMLKREEKIEGSIRLSTAQGFASTALLDLLDRFRRIYPDVHFKSSIGHGLQDLLAGKVDIVTITGEPEKNDNLMLLDRGTNYYIPLASPEVISAFGPFKTVSDLSRVRVFAYNGKERIYTPYLFKGGRREKVTAPDCFLSDSLYALKSAALNSKGVVLDLPYFFCAEEVRKGQLVPVLDGWQKPSAALYTVVSKTLWKIPRFRIFAEWFSAESRKYYEVFPN